MLYSYICTLFPIEGGISHKGVSRKIRFFSYQKRAICEECSFFWFNYIFGLKKRQSKCCLSLFQVFRNISSDLSSKFPQTFAVRGRNNGTVINISCVIPSCFCVPKRKTISVFPTPVPYLLFHIGRLMTGSIG